MRIRIVAVGSKMPAWVNSTFSDFAKRFSKPFSIILSEIPLQKRSQNRDVQKIVQEEGMEILKAIPKDAFVIALDEKGVLMNTRALTDEFIGWRTRGLEPTFVIGGPDGLSEAVLKRANLKLSLSPLTFPHPLVRLILIEQLYRVFSIINKHPYHRD